MPSKRGPDEVFLHVPIPKRLREDLGEAAPRAGMYVREAVVEALDAWVGAKRYRTVRSPKEGPGST